MFILLQILIQNLQPKYLDNDLSISLKRQIQPQKVLLHNIGDRKIIRMRNVVDLGDAGESLHKPH